MAGLWVDGQTGGWVGGKALSVCNVESMLSAYTDGISRSRYKIPDTTLPSCDTEFLFPTCSRES